MVLTATSLGAVPAPAQAAAIEVPAQSGIARVLEGGPDGALDTTDPADLDSEILTSIAAAFHSGHHTPAAPDAARTHARLAAEKGEATAMRIYGRFLLSGVGGRSDAAQALIWLERAAAEGDGLAAYWAGVIRETDGGRAQPDFVAAAAHYRAAWSRGLVQAATRLARLHLEGAGVPQDAGRAVELLQAAASAGYPPAQTGLARQHYLGEGTLQDYAEAFRLYDLAGRAGDPRGLSMAAYMLARGQAKAARSDQALDYLLVAAARGNVQAQYNLGVVFAGGEGVRPRPVLAHALFNVAAASGHAPALEARKKLARRLKPAEIETAQELARAFPDRFKIFDLKPASTGTGFFVSAGGAIVTNHHVIDGCAAVLVKDPEAGLVPAEVVTARDAPIDVALLMLAPAPGTKMARHVGVFARSQTLRLGEEVTIFGFPKYGMLSEKGVLSTGSLSAMEGLGSNPDTIQVSAPIQPGNSGGAILNERGDIIGVVHSALAPQLDEARAYIPQNVNFGTKAEIVKRMLRAVGQPYYIRPESEAASIPQKVRAEMAQQITRQLFCMVHDLQQ